MKIYFNAKRKKSKKSRSWVIKQHRDQFFKKSKVLGYRSRAAFKLIEINKKFGFIKKNSNILDVGSTPGGWSQVAKKIAINGKVLAVDREPMANIENVTFFKRISYAQAPKREFPIFLDPKLMWLSQIWQKIQHSEKGKQKLRLYTNK